jgi:hypothetical protein
VPALAIVPILDFPTDLILGVAVTLLEFSFELVLASGDDVEVIVRELTPLF